MRSAHRIIVVLAVLIAAGIAVRRQSPRRMGIVDLLNLPRLGDPEISPDGRTVLFTRGDADWKADRRVTHVWRVSTDGGQPLQLTFGTESESSPRWAPDGKTIAFTAKRGDNEFAQLYLLPIDGGEARQLTTHANADGSGAVRLTNNGVPETNARVSPDDSRVLFISQANARFDTYYNGRLFVVPAAGGPARVVAGETESLDVDRASWSKDGKSIYFLANLGVHEEIFSVPAEGGKPTQLTDGRQNIGAWSLAGDRLAMTISDSTSDEIWTMRVGDQKPSRLTHVFDYVTRDFKLGKQEAIQWKGADGMTVEGALTYPVDYQAGRRYPLAVMTHGGPQAADKYSLGSTNYEFQVLAGKGYATLQPNYRGSTGYGDAFLRDMVGHYFQNAHLDVMTGVDEMIRRGIADPDRMVKMGWSGGGHMTNKIITFTDRFKAASSGAGVAQWVSMYAQTDMRAFRTPWFGGTPWQKNAPIEAYWNNSPLKDIANVKTPTIFFVGERDPRVPMPQSIEMHRALKSNGVPTHLYVAPREPPVWAELRHQLFKLNTEIAWFEQYATKRPFTPEKAPAEESNKDGRPTTDQP